MAGMTCRARAPVRAGRIPVTAARRDHRPSRLANRIRQRLEVVGGGSGRLGDLQPDDLPPKRGCQPCGVPRAQVVTVRLGIGCERTEYRSRLRIDIGEGGHRRLAARGPRATAKRAHEREG